VLRIFGYHTGTDRSSRQSVRVGSNEGKLIEDYGVVSDYIVRPLISDVFANNSKSQWDRIAATLETLSRNADPLSFKAYPQEVVDMSLPMLKFDVSCMGIEKLLVSWDGGKNILSQNLDESIDSLFELNVQLNGPPGYYRFLLNGFAKYDVERVRTYRTIRMIPAVDSFLTLPSNQLLNLGRSDPAIFNLQENLTSGWSRNMQIGNFVQYDNDVNSKLSFFINSAPAVSLHFKADYRTEADYDYFRIGFQDSTGIHDFIQNATNPAAPPGLSGNGSVNATFSFRPVGAFEVFFLFSSDAGTTSQGVRINEATLTRL
jgi:hypothetical protein